MKKKPAHILVTDGNTAVADVAYRINEICIIYPITPSSSMGELSDQWSAEKKPNIWNNVPDVIEMQSEGGAAGAIHGALQTGALVTTFTASQGLLLMIPNMFRIAAELTPTVFHVSTRTIAPQGMSIYCDHSDVMAARSTGFAMLCSENVQTAHDMALLTQAASLESRVPFLHFFDGFRTSNEISKIKQLTDDQIRSMIDDGLIITHRNNRMSPENPFARGVIYNNDIFFQQRESVNPFYEKIPEIVQNCMDRFAKLTDRNYKTVEYYGHPKAEHIIVIMGSGSETVRETIDYLQKQNEKIGMLRVRLFQPLPIGHLLKELPTTCRNIAVLDRTKEPGANGEPLYQSVSTAILSAYNQNSLPIKQLPKVIGGRFGIGGKEFTPAMVTAVFKELKQKAPKNHFTIGIEDDVSNASLKYDANLDIEPDNVIRAMFFGLGADGTVSANKNTIKIIGEQTDFFVQGYFVYDSKKSGSRTISHLRFGPNQIHSTYLIKSANFIGCHQFQFIEKLDVLKNAGNKATLLLNSPYSAEEVWEKLPRSVQETIINKQIEFYVIDAYKVAETADMGSKINTIMQTCFFALAKILPRDQAIAKIKDAIAKTYATKGKQVIKQNFAAVDQALANLAKVEIPGTATSEYETAWVCSKPATKTDLQPVSTRLTCNVIGKMLADRGDELPVSAIPPDGTYPCNTTQWEKRNVSLYAPVWNSETCIQCGKCSLVCPHSVIRAKHYDNKRLKNAPITFKSAKLRGKNGAEQSFTLQAYPEDCTGCGLCVEACPVKGKAINLELKDKFIKTEKKNIEFFENIPWNDRSNINTSTINGVQFLRPYFEFSGACAGCGEALYVKLLSQLFGDRMIIANACGCSSVYGGNLPTIPWVIDEDGNGPSWSSSLFEDNAEFGFGFMLTEEKHNRQALELLNNLAPQLNKKLVHEIQTAVQENETQISQQRNSVMQLKEQLKHLNNGQAKNLLSLADHLVKHSIWAVGGDGWAYDIGYGGLDHVIASGRNINLLVLDTEVYSNTGGQASKATPRASVAKFAANGKDKAKKDLGIMAMSYGNVYVAGIALGANPMQSIKAFKEAEAYNGPSMIIAYSHCIAHGIDMSKGMRQQELAVKCGYWPLYRYDPELEKQGLNPLQLDSQKPSIPFKEYSQNENRFKILMRQDPKRAELLMKLAQEDIYKRWEKYAKMAK